MEAINREMVMIVMAVIILAILFSVYIIKRNENVYTFQDRNICTAYNVAFRFYSLNDDELVSRKKEREWIGLMIDSIESKSYNRMLYSFKPLKLKHWFTPEEIAFLKLGGEI